MTLTLRNVVKQYGTHLIIDHLSFCFPDHGLYCISGPSGCGKTTLLRLIAGLEQTDEGEINKTGPIAMSFQEYRLFPQLSAVDNVTALCGRPSEMKEQAVGLLDELGFSQAQMHLKPSSLSGGMKQRVSLCRAFISDAPILLLDEPLKELDETLRDKVLDIVSEKAMRTLVILTAHEPETFTVDPANIIRLG